VTTTLEAELRLAVDHLTRLRASFALVGGLAVSVRGEVRFTRDIDLAVCCPSDRDTERLAADFAAAGYEIAALVEHDARDRLSTVRLRSRSKIFIDLLAASSGIEAEIVDAATSVDIPHVGPITVARAEELLATKVLAMSDARPQDRIDARSLLLANPDIQLEAVRERLALIRARGFDRDEDLEGKLETVLQSIR
jgi:hypothetical protein